MAEIKDFARMCNEYHHDACYEECPIGSLVDRYGMIRDCLGFMRVYPKGADRIITEWCNEHPQKTYAQDFFEKFPDAPKYGGRPDVCRTHIYGGELVCNVGGCKECWNEVMPDA